MVLKRGTLIRVRAFGGKEIVRRFLAKRNGTVLICSDQEYQSARREKREPLCVGFPMADVIAIEVDGARQRARINRRSSKNKLTRIHRSHHV